tara:strand:- start:99 stop:362 length:264 start_codon:yes stop_codon:yes gene_type:complete
MKKNFKTKQDIEKELISIISEIYNIKNDLLNKEDNFKDHIAWDSMNGLMIMMKINDNIINNILPEDILGSNSIEDLSEKIYIKLNHK